MIIDFHVHVFKEKISKKALETLSEASNMVPYGDGTLNGLSNIMEKDGIDYAINVPVATSVNQVESINEYILEQNKHFKETHIISLGAIHPDSDNYKEVIRDLANQNVIGIKLHPVYQNEPADSIKYVNIINEAFKYNMIVVIHTGLDIGHPESLNSSIEKIVSLLSKINKGKMVLAHLGSYQQWDQVYELLAGKDVYFDTAFAFSSIEFADKNKKTEQLIDKELLIKIIKKHGADKILFGSDNPWMRYKTMLDYFNDLPLSKEEKELILYKNALKLLEGVNL